MKKAAQEVRHRFGVSKETVVEWWTITRRTVKEWSVDHAFQHAAAIGFYTLFSLAPIMIIAIAVAGFVLSPEAAREEIVEQVAEMVGPESALAVEKAILEARPEGRNLWSTIMGVVLLLVGATTVFAQLQRSLNQIWSVVSKPTRSSLLEFIEGRVLSLALVLTIGFLLLVSLVFSTGLTAFIRYAEERVPVSPIVAKVADVGISLVVFTILFGLIFKFLPDVRLRWRDVWRGACLTGILFIAGKFLIAFYLTHYGPASAYGAAGALIAVIMWVYYSVLILLFGAEFTKVYMQEKGIRVRPKKTAARVRKEIMEDLPGI